MTTKEYLSQVRKLNKMINGRLQDLEDMRQLAESVSSKQPVADLVISSGRKDRLESIIVKIIDAERDIDAMVERYIDKRSLIVGQIEELDAEEFSVLRLRFIDGWDADRISGELKYSERQTYRIYRRAMHSFEEKYGETYKSA